MPLDLEASDPPLETSINTVVGASRRVEGLLGDHGVLLDLEAEGQDRGEGVRELQDADGAYEAGDVGELRDGGADYPGECPVGGHEGYPEELAGFGGERRGVHELLQDLDVGDFDADVAVETGGDETSHQIHDVGGGLPVVG